MKQEAMLTLGSEVKRMRLQAKLSQEKLAEKLNTTRETISQIERGKTNRPDDAYLEGFEVHLGLTRQRAHELMGAVPSIDQDDPLAEVLQIAALPDHAARMKKWKDLPVPMQKAVHQWAQDLLLDAALQVRESSAQAPHQRRRKSQQE